MHVPSRSSNNPKSISLNSSANIDLSENTSKKNEFKEGSLRNLVRFLRASSETTFLSSSDMEKKFKGLLIDKQSSPQKSRKNRTTHLFKSVFSWVKSKKDTGSKETDEQMYQLLFVDIENAKKFAEAFKTLIDNLHAEKAALAISQELLILLQKNEPQDLKEARERGDKFLSSYNNYDRQIYHENKIKDLQSRIFNLEAQLKKNLGLFEEYHTNLEELEKSYGSFSKIVRDEVTNLKKIFHELHLHQKKASKILTLAELRLVSDLKNIDQDTFSSVIPILSKTILNIPMYVKTPSKTTPKILLGFDKSKKTFKPGEKQIFAVKAQRCHLYMTSCYPKNEAKREGDPIADDMLLAELKTAEANLLIFSGADGCNWGKNPAIAAEIVNRTFINECLEAISKEFLNTQDAIRVSLNSLIKALDAIFEATHSHESSISPSTTHVGIIIKRNSDGSAIGTLVSLGDMKVFIKKANGQVEELTLGNRLSQDPGDPGGRLHGDTLTMDARNLSIMTLKLDKGDTLLPMSDGIHDNLSFDPHLPPEKVKELLLQSKALNSAQLYMLNNLKLPDEWKSGIKELDLLRSIYYSVKIQELDQNGENISLAEKLIKHAYIITQPSRDFMEAYPFKKLPDDYTLFPGKLDHASVAEIII